MAPRTTEGESLRAECMLTRKKLEVKRAVRKAFCDDYVSLFFRFLDLLNFVMLRTQTDFTPAFIAAARRRRHLSSIAQRVNMGCFFSFFLYFAITFISRVRWAPYHTGYLA